MRNGYELNDSTITVASALLWGNNMTPASTDARKLAELIAWDMTERGQFALGSGKQFVERTVLMTEPVAAILAKKYRTVDELEAQLVKLARRPVRERVYAKYYAADDPGDGPRHDRFPDHRGRGPEQGADPARRRDRDGEDRTSGKLGRTDEDGGYKPLTEFRLTSDLKPSKPRESRHDRGTRNREQYRRRQNGGRGNRDRRGRD